MNLQAKGDKKSELGIYVHVPFCGTICDFCAFYQEKPKRSDIEDYLEGMWLNFSQKMAKFQPFTMFWGGGTPGLLMAKDIERLGGMLVDKFGKPKEWTIEMAPATVKADKLEVMKDLGVTRISMGVQSFDEQLLKQLGRVHSPKQVYEAYEKIRSAGFDNVNLDLMFALPGQDMKQWEADMDEAIRLDSEHLSTYCLTFEEDTALYVKLSQGKIKRNEELELQMYRKTWEYLSENGYPQYEISNFAKKGHECLHNINTWKMHDWIGLGPSASSQYGMRRYTNVHSLQEWLEGLRSGSPKYVDVIDLDKMTLANDAVLFGLRMDDGVDLGEIEARFEVELDAVRKYIRQLEGEGYCVIKGDHVCLTTEGKLLSDQIAEAFV